jgi:hypothetical protein
MTPGEGMMSDKLHPNFQSLFKDELVGRIINLKGNQDGDVPSFTSIVFPYSGYHILRDGWNKEAIHLYLKGGRKGVGHKSASGNQIQLTAFGRTILYRGGPRSYGTGPFEGHNTYQLSSFGYNTVVVDSKSQLNENAPLQKEPIQARWLASLDFDFAEGIYDSGYESISESITHQRQVIFIKKAGLFIVTDRIGSEIEREYSQIWNFNHVYQESQISLDKDNQKFWTTDKNGPNVAIYNFSPAQVSYEKYYGQKEPEVRGWSGVEPHHAALDIHANWKGTGQQQLVTLLHPTRAGQSELLQINSDITNDITKISIQLDNDKNIFYLSSKTKEDILEIENIKIKGEALLLSIENDSIKGIALGAKDISYKGSVQKINSANFMFEIDNGKVKVIEEIKIPATFKWEETKEGIIPTY